MIRKIPIRQQRVRGSVFVTAPISIKWDVGLRILHLRGRRPVESWIEKKRATRSVPFQPCVREQVLSAPLSNHQSNIVGAA